MLSTPVLQPHYRAGGCLRLTKYRSHSLSTNLNFIASLPRDLKATLRSLSSKSAKQNKTCSEDSSRNLSTECIIALISLFSVSLSMWMNYLLRPYLSLQVLHIGFDKKRVRGRTFILRLNESKI